MSIGHNNPPDPIDECLAAHADMIMEAKNWTDGELVENEGQMAEVDRLIKGIKAALKDATDSEKSITTPMYDAWKAEKERCKPKLDRLVKIRDDLVASVSQYKKQLAAKKEAAKREAWWAAWKARTEAERAVAQADDSDIDAKRAAADAQQAAINAANLARAATKDTVKGMRKVTLYNITDHRAALNWIVKNDRGAVTAFIDGYVQRNHKKTTIDGVTVTTEKEAF